MKYDRSKFSGDQILGFVFDEEKQSLQTSLDAEFAIELDHKDGDSVLSILPTLELSENQEKPCIGINNIVLYVKQGSAKVEVSPTSEGDIFFHLCESTGPGMLKPQLICAKRIRLVLGENSEAYVCGQG